MRLTLRQATARRTSPDRPALVLVGNARIQQDLGAFIDSFDCVVRCNDVKNWGKNCGVRTHVLFVNNHGGTPCERMVSTQSLRSRAQFPEVREAWFSCPENVWSRAILDSNQLNHLGTHYASEHMRSDMIEALKAVRHTSFEMPSTGFCAFWHLTHEDRFQGCDIYLTGFSFEVWEGHPQDAEKELILAACRDSNRLHFVPVSASWEFARNLRNQLRFVRKHVRTMLQLLASRGLSLYHFKASNSN